VALHVIVLMLDRYLPFSLFQVLVPFTSAYRPVWVGLGVISLYLLALVTVTFYLRKRIGMRAFRLIHVLSLLSYLGVTLHALFAGTDSTLSAAQIIYKGSFLSVIFLTSFWLVNLALGKLKKPVRAR
jgi:predicted ferric reductase